VIKVDKNQSRDYKSDSKAKNSKEDKEKFITDMKIEVVKEIFKLKKK